MKTEQILLYLKPYGIGTPVNISALLQQMFPVTGHENQEELTQIKWEITALLLPMENDGLIGLDRKQLSELANKNTSGNIVWLDKIEITASLRVSGHNYLNPVSSNNINITGNTGATTVGDLNQFLGLNHSNNLQTTQPPAQKEIPKKRINWELLIKIISTVLGSGVILGLVKAIWNHIKTNN